METCNACAYCRVNRTKTIPRGVGTDRICPVCNTVYPEEKEEVEAEKKASITPHV